MAANTKTEKKSSYFKNVRSELRKTSWPTKKEVMNYTTVVFVMCLFSAVVIGLFDFGFKALFSLFV